MIELIHDDNANVDIPADAAIVSDPPYGINNDCDYRRTKFNKAGGGGRLWPQIAGDDRPFDPTRWLAHKHVALFGFQYFAEHLPIGTILVWLKRCDKMIGKWNSDCELAWINRGKGVYLKRHVWNGAVRETERGDHFHPTQKPIAVMKWLIERTRIPPGTLIVDPYMGAGATILAAAELGYPAMGIELHRPYFETAQRRVAQLTTAQPTAAP